MTIEIVNETDGITMKLEGRLDTNTAPELEKSIEENLDLDRNLILDMTKLEYISSAGLRTLLATQKKMNQNGKLKLIGVCDEVMEIFELTGFVELLNIE